MRLPGISDITKVASIVPELAVDLYQFLRFDIEQLLLARDGEDFHCVETEDGFEFHEGLDPYKVPLSMHEAGRIALELVMITRASREDREKFQKMVAEVMPDIDSPQHAMDVVMSLCGMVSVLADDDDLARFGETILQHEASS